MSHPELSLVRSCRDQMSVDTEHFEWVYVPKVRNVDAILRTYGT